MKADAIVIGAGSAGCLAAFTLASKGFDTLLLDGKPRALIGNKLCGNALGAHHIQHIGISLPDDVISLKNVSDFEIISPAGHKIEVHGGDLVGYMLKRYKFGQFLLELAESHGAKLKDQTHVNAPLLSPDGQHVIGVEANRSEHYHAGLIIDASGLKSAFRDRLPPSFGMHRDLAPSDVCVTYRELRRLKRPVENPNTLLLYFDQLKYTGGYGWIFFQDEYTANVGLGLGRMEGRAHPRQRTQETLLKMKLFEGSELVGGDMGPAVGGMDVPVTHSFPTLANNGVLLAGEAGMIINPVDAGGNGPALTSGRIAGQVAVEALEAGDVSWAFLNRYNERLFGPDGMCTRYYRIDHFRIQLQSLTNADLDYGIEHKVIEGKDLLRISRIGRLEGFVRLWRAKGRPSLAFKLAEISKKMEAVGELCAHYPAPQDFPGWRDRVEALYAETKRKYPPFFPGSN